MIAALTRLGKPSPFTQALADWALRARARELYDLVAFGLVAVPLGFLGEPTWWLLATPPLGLSALGGWGLLERSRALPASLTWIDVDFPDVIAACSLMRGVLMRRLARLGELSERPQPTDERAHAAASPAGAG